MADIINNNDVGEPQSTTGEPLNNGADLVDSNDAPKPKLSAEEYETLIKERNKEAKQHRLRANELEKKLNEIEAEREALRIKTLEDEGKYKDLYETQITEIQRLKDIESKFTDFEKREKERIESEKKVILDSLPLDMKEQFADLPLDKLKFVSQKLSTVSNSQGIAGNVDKPLNVTQTFSEFVVTH